jgi:hypothetical protein
MRLLKLSNTAGEFCSLIDFDFGVDIPRYAILSYTWGKEEVTKDMMDDGTAKRKPSYGKIRFCGEQARRDNLQYFWIDTCCIDKSSSAELQEAINSMFRWYRGWTLQELVAPPLVEFFSKEGEQLGNKKSLERHIHEVTGIPVKALRGSSLADFDTSERMLWAERRETTREEDMAYSLLGIFDIYMPLIYGEGRENAFKRLREEINKALKGTLLCPITWAKITQLITRIGTHREDFSVTFSLSDVSEI